MGNNESRRKYNLIKREREFPKRVLEIIKKYNGFEEKCKKKFQFL